MDERSFMIVVRRSVAEGAPWRGGAQRVVEEEKSRAVVVDVVEEVNTRRALGWKSEGGMVGDELTPRRDGRVSGGLRLKMEVEIWGRL